MEGGGKDEERVGKGVGKWHTYVLLFNSELIPRNSSGVARGSVHATTITVPSSLSLFFVCIVEKGIGGTYVGEEAHFL